MEDELNDVTRSQTELAVQLEDTKSKLTSTTTDLTSERKRSVIWNCKLYQLKVIKLHFHFIVLQHFVTC